MRHTIGRAALVLFLSCVLAFQTAGLDVGAQSSEFPSNWTAAAYGDNSQVFIPNDINSKGVVVGTLQMPDGYYPAQLADGEISLLGDGTEMGGAAAINDEGVIVGTKNYPDNRTVAAIFTTGSTTELNDGQAYDVDESGTIVGSVNQVPAYWPQGEAPLALLALVEGRFAQVFALNANGWMVGDAVGPHWSDPEKLADHAVLWRDGQIVDLGSVETGDTIAVDINDSGTVVAWTQVNDTNDSSAYSFASFTWQDGVRTALPIPEGDTSCLATSISDLGWIAGSCGVGANDQHAVLWVDGQVVGLEKLLGDGWKAGTAVVNDAGQITGQGYFHNELKVYVLTPDQ